MRNHFQLLLALAAIGLPFSGEAHHPPPTWSSQRLVAPEREWNLRLGPEGSIALRMPRDHSRIDALPAALATEARRKLGEREVNIEVLRDTARRFDHETGSGKLHMTPEYERDMREVLIAATQLRANGPRTIMPHAPILRALPAYSQIRVFVPRDGKAAVERELAQLGLTGRATLMIDDDTAPGSKATPWVRDQLLVVDAGRRTILATPMRFYPGRLADSDLKHIGRLRARGREVLRIPLFFRSGNLLLARQGRRILFVGQGELYLNAAGYVQASLSRPDSADVVAGLRTLSGADQVVVLPNTERLFHIDQYLAPLADGVAALLKPLDPHNLAPEDADAIAQAGHILRDLGFRIVAIPTVAERIAAYQSPVNIVPYRDLQQQDRAALVPRFADRKVITNHGERSLNMMIVEAYRSAEIRPVEVDDNFAPLMGNTHCVTVPLH